MRRTSFIVALGMLSASLLAHADTLTTFYLNATTAAGGTVQGTVDFDRNNVFSSSANITYTLAGNVLVSGHSTATGEASSGSTFYDLAFRVGSYDLDLELPPTTGAAFNGQICTVTQRFAGCQGTSAMEIFNPFGEDLFTAATLSDVPPVAMSPEPSSIALVGTAFLGIVGVVRRRLT